MRHRVRRLAGVLGVAAGLAAVTAVPAGADPGAVSAGGISLSVPVVACGDAIGIVSFLTGARCQGTVPVDPGDSTPGGDAVPAGSGPGRAVAHPPAAPGGTAGTGGQRGPAGTGTVHGGTVHGGTVRGGAVALGGVAASVPVLVCGNGVSILGALTAASCDGSFGDGGPAVTGAARGGALALGGVALSAPVVVCGNAVNVLSAATFARCGVAAPAGAGPRGSVSGGPGGAGGIAVSLPIVVCGNAVNVLGHLAEGRCQGGSGGNPPGGGAGNPPGGGGNPRPGGSAAGDGGGPVASASGGDLPVTGADTASIALAGLALTSAGAGVVLLARRREGARAAA